MKVSLPRQSPDGPSKRRTSADSSLEHTFTQLWGPIKNNVHFYTRRIFGIDRILEVVVLQRVGGSDFSSKTVWSHHPLQKGIIIYCKTIDFVRQNPHKCVPKISNARDLYVFRAQTGRRAEVHFGRFIWVSELLGCRQRKRQNLLKRRHLDSHRALRSGGHSFLYTTGKMSWVLFINLLSENSVHQNVDTFRKMISKHWINWLIWVE